MRHLRELAALCGLVCCAFTRCDFFPGEDPDAGGGAAGAPEAGQAGQPSNDAGTGGAGGVGGEHESGGATSAGASGAEQSGGAPGEPARPVRVKVLNDRDVPTPNAAVVFYDPHGQNPVVVRTGADGVAAREAPAGSIVTVVIFFQMQDAYGFGYDFQLRQLSTIFGVEPGDDLLVRDELLASVRGFEEIPPPPIQVPVRFTPPEGGAYYYGHTSCPGYTSTTGNSPLLVTIPRDCPDADGKIRLIVEAVGTDDQPVAHAVFEDWQVVEDGSLNVESWVPADSYRVPLLNAPSGLRLISMLTDFYRGGEHFWTGAVHSSSFSAPALFTHPPGMLAFDAVDVQVSLRYLPEDEEPTSMRRSREAVSAARPIDLSKFLPPLRHATFTPDGSGLFRVRWTGDDALAGGDGTFVRLEGARYADPTTGSGKIESFYWRMLGPAGVSELVPPPLPTELATPVVDSSELSVHVVHVYDSTELDSYAHFRHEFGRSFSIYDSPPLRGPDSVTLRASVN